MERFVRQDVEAATGLSKEAAEDGCKPDLGGGAKGGPGSGNKLLEREAIGWER